MGLMRKHRKFWSENMKGRDHSEDLGVYGRIILQWILGKQGGRCGLDSSDASFKAFMAVMFQGLLGCDVMQCCGRTPAFRRAMLPPSSG
jgi:hypothetical protein